MEFAGLLKIADVVSKLIEIGSNTGLHVISFLVLRQDN
jgi:hypothetical protein